MTIIFGDYLDMNHTLKYGPSREDMESKEEAEILRPYWDKFIQGELNLESKRGIKAKWMNPKEGYVWIEVCNNWFDTHGYTTYHLMLPDMHTLDEDLFSERSSTGKWIDEENNVIVTEYYFSRTPNPPKVFEDYINSQREYEKSEFIRLTGCSLEDKKAEELVKMDAAERMLHWKNKTSARWFH